MSVSVRVDPGPKIGRNQTVPAQNCVATNCKRLAFESIAKTSACAYAQTMP